MKAGAIFDMDGLLFDTEILYNKEWKKVADENGLILEEKMLDEIRGTGGTVMYETINRYWPNIDAERLRKQIFENTKEILSKNVPVKCGVLELLRYLKENGVKTAVASSSPMESIQNNLKVSGLESYFDTIVSGEQVLHGKPAPDIFLLAAEKLSLSPKECYVFEDGPNGIYAGVRAGCATIMIPDLISPTEELHEITVGIYKSLKEVLDAIEAGEC